MLVYAKAVVRFSSVLKYLSHFYCCEWLTVLFCSCIYLVHKKQLTSVSHATNNNVDNNVWFAAVERTTTDCRWLYQWLSSAHDWRLFLFQSLRDIIIVPLWQLRLSVCLRKHKFTYLLTFEKLLFCAFIILFFFVMARFWLVRCVLSVMSRSKIVKISFKRNQFFIQMRREPVGEMFSVVFSWDLLYGVITFIVLVINSVLWTQCGYGDGDSDYEHTPLVLAAGGANAPAYWAPASLIRPTPKKTPIA